MKSLFVSLALLLSIVLSAQNNDIVEWTTSFDATTQTITIDADIKGKWVIYSQHTDPDGPIPLSFEFDKTKGVILDGPTQEMNKPIEEKSEMFGVTVRKFMGNVSFSQKINEGWKPGTILNGNLTYMACDDEKCLPPETIPFEVKL